MSNPTPITVNENKASSKYIDRNPPLATDPDLNRKVVDYLAYLKEILNFSVATTGKRITDTSGYVNELVRTSNSLISTIYDTQNGLVTQISQQAGEITLMASKLDNIGGRNLLLNSATKHIYPYSSATMTFTDGVTVTEWGASDAITCSGTKGGDNVFGTLGGISAASQSSINGKKYVHSIYIMNNDTVDLDVTDNGIGAYVTVAPGESKRVVMTGTGNGSNYVQFSFRTASTFNFTYWHPQIEYGEILTDWSPAPEDKVGNDEIISKINVSPESIVIAANKVDLQGLVKFTNLSTSGQTTINGANITTGLIQDAAGKNTWNLDTGALTITDGSIHINSGSDLTSKIVFDATNTPNNPGDFHLSIQPYMIYGSFTDPGGDVYFVEMDAEANWFEAGLSTSTIQLQNQLRSDMLLMQRYTKNPITITKQSELNHTHLYFYNGASNKYTTLLDPDSNGAGRIFLGDGTSNKKRTSLTNTGLEFANSSGTVTASYPATSSKLSPTYTTNSYCSSTSVGRVWIRRQGSFGFLHFNLSIDTTPLVSSAGFVEIGRFSGVTLKQDEYCIVPSQSGNSNILMQILTTGIMKIYTDYGSASGFYRVEMPLIFA